MNEQRPPGGIEWTRVPKYDGSEGFRKGFTWNPLTGCIHGCEWVIAPWTSGDRAVRYAECYAKTIADRYNSGYPNGFADSYFHPRRLAEPKKQRDPAGIFLDSMSDLMAHNVKESHIEAVLQVCEETPEHIYLLLTKNAPRLVNFDFPPNVWVGVSTPADRMFGKYLDYHQRRAYMFKALDVLSNINAGVYWISMEPLNGDYADIFMSYADMIDWVVVGATSDGRKNYAPEDEQLLSVLEWTREKNIPVFYKGNMKSSRIARNQWRSEFPSMEQVASGKRNWHAWRNSWKGGVKYETEAEVQGLWRDIDSSEVDC